MGLVMRIAGSEVFLHYPCSPAPFLAWNHRLETQGQWEALHPDLVFTLPANCKENPSENSTDDYRS